MTYGACQRTANLPGVALACVQGGCIINEVRQSSGAKLHIDAVQPGRSDRSITISLIDGR